MSSAVKTQGTLLQRATGGSPAWATITETTSITGPGGEAGEIDVTNFDSTAKEYLPGLKDEGTLTADMNYLPDDTQQQNVISDRTNQTLTNYRIIFNDSASPQNIATFSAYVTGFSLAAAPDDKWTATATLRISGAVTFPS